MCYVDISFFKTWRVIVMKPKILRRVIYTFDETESKQFYISNQDFEKPQKKAIQYKILNYDKFLKKKLDIN